MDVVESARGMLEDLSLCDHCLGRQFALLLTGTTNDERGRALKLALGMQGHSEIEGDPSLLRNVARSGEKLASNVLQREGQGVEEESCGLCGGLMDHLDAWTDLVEEKLEGYEFDGFLVGTRVPEDLVAREEEFWTRHGASFVEPLKRELNREVGRRLEERLGVDADLENPDVSVLLKPEEQEVGVDPNPVYFYGRYEKLERGIPQTEWPCRVCEGEGCMRCDGTGKLYDESVEALMEPHFLEATGGERGVLHGCGREDVDALMKGSGRPFVYEVKEPVKRRVDTGGLEDAINQESGGKIRVSNLGRVNRDAVEEVKSARPDKTYRVVVSGSFTEEKLKEALSEIRGEVVQQTPRRVAHRRADRERSREVKEVDLVGIDDGEAVLEITGEAGLYVKELVHGDSGRTRPNLSEALASDVECSKLDVLDVGYRRD